MRRAVLLLFCVVVALKADTWNESTEPYNDGTPTTDTPATTEMHISTPELCITEWPEESVGTTVESEGTTVESEGTTVESKESGESEESGETEGLKLAEPCNEDQCKLPDCRCSSTNIPGGLLPRDTPQFVTVTFDDGVNILNVETYRRLLNGRRNSNGCPAGATFYVSHQYTNYQLVNELYNNGFEIALHSITHRTPQEFWAEATYEDLVKEIADQKKTMSHFAKIPYESLKGVRLPFLQMAGNNSFLMMKRHNLVYDSSWPTIQFTNPPLWPYTLDFASTQDCQVPPCPTASIPGVWVQPMVAWTDLLGMPCSMVDACFNHPDYYDSNAWYQFILTNFERHYLGNRAPFGFYVHEWLLATYPAVETALSRFLNLVNNLEDAFQVNANDVLEWVKDPVPINEYKEKLCRVNTPAPCSQSFCELQPEHNPLQTYWMTACNTCPRVYPWIGNPLGV